MAGIVLSECWSQAHGLLRWRWLQSFPAEQRTELELRVFLDFLATLDAGLPLLKRDVDVILQGFPALNMLAQAPLGLMATNGCPVCLQPDVSDMLQLVGCGHYCCYPCLRTRFLSLERPSLTCPTCEHSLLLKASSFLRLAAPPSLPTPLTMYPTVVPLLSEVTRDSVRGEWLTRTLQQSPVVPTLVISDWVCTALRFRHVGAHVTFADLQTAQTLHARNPVFRQLVILDARAPVQSVSAFMCEFAHITQRWYVAARWSLDHYVLSTWQATDREHPGPPVHTLLDQYAEFLALQLTTSSSPTTTTTTHHVNP